MDTITPLTVLVVSPERFMSSLMPAFEEALKTYRGAGTDVETEMKFKYVHSLRDLEIFSPIGVPGDFMALFVDTENLAALGGLRTDMLRLEHNFRVTRTVLVNGCCRSGPPGACQQVSHLADEMRVPPMNAHISSDFKYNKRIALKLIRMAASCTGAAHGTPARLPVVEDLQFVLANSTLYTTRMTTAGNIDMDVDSDE